MAITFGENAPFRCDIVGSFLRPDVLNQDRRRHCDPRFGGKAKSRWIEGNH